MQMFVYVITADDTILQRQLAFEVAAFDKESGIQAVRDYSYNQDRSLQNIRVLGVLEKPCVLRTLPVAPDDAWIKSRPN